MSRVSFAGAFLLICVFPVVSSGSFFDIFTEISSFGGPVGGDPAGWTDPANAFAIAATGDPANPGVYMATGAAGSATLPACVGCFNFIVEIEGLAVKPPGERWQYGISSFFDIFTEISIDSVIDETTGQLVMTWGPGKSMAFPVAGWTPGQRQGGYLWFGYDDLNHDGVIGVGDQVGTAFASDRGFTNIRAQGYHILDFTDPIPTNGLRSVGVRSQRLAGGLAAPPRLDNFLGPQSGSNNRIIIVRTLSVIETWAPANMQEVNDFHLILRPRRQSGDVMVVTDLDMAGFYTSIDGSTRTVERWSNGEISIYWTFPDTVVDINHPAKFGYSFWAYGSLEYDVRAWHWTKDGERVGDGYDAGLDWVKLEVQLMPIIKPLPPIRPGPIDPGNVLYDPLQPVQVQRSLGMQFTPMSITELAGLVAVPNVEYSDPGPITVFPGQTLGYGWAWPGLDPTYVNKVDLFDGMGNRVATFTEAAVLGEGPPTAPADFNQDYAVDRHDYTTFQSCATGPSIAYYPVRPPGCTLPPDEEGHIAADFDQDNDVDQVDFGIFQRCYAGSVRPVGPDCTR